ncbi:unnamed protein product, partial [Prorocentrum cordatum]
MASHGPVLTSQEMRDVAAAMEEAPTFPSQGHVAKAANGKGKGFIGRKRRATDGQEDELGDDDDCYPLEYLRELCQSEFAGMRESLTTDISSSVGKTVATNYQTLMSAIGVLRKEVANQSTDIDQQVQQAEITKLKREMEEFRKLLAVAEERQPPPAQPPVGFTREVDPAVLVAVTSLEAVTVCLDKFLSDVGFDSSECKIVVQGQEPSKRFAARFPGLPQPAARKVVRALGGLKDGHTWKSFFCDAPGSASRTSVHMGLDKNPKQIKAEITLRRCRDAILAECGDANRIFMDRDLGVLPIKLDRILQVRVAAGRETPPELWWNEGALQKHGLSKDMVARATEEISQGPPEPTWFATWDARALLQAAGEKASLERVALVPGRVLQVSLHSAQSCLAVFNAHNHELTVKEESFVSQTIVRELAAAAESPDKHFVVVNGGFNFSAGESLIAGSPEVAVRRSARRHDAHAARWREALGRMLEVEGSEPTRFERGRGAAAAIDRFFCSLAGLVEAANWDAMSPPFQVELYKELMRIAGVETRDQLFKSRPNHPGALLQVARVVARVVWRQDKRLARKMLESHPMVEELLEICGSDVRLRHPPSFQEWSAKIQREALDQQKAEIEDRRAREGDSRRLRMQAKALERKARLWSPIGRRITLAAAHVSAGATVSDPAERTKALGEHWKPVFSKKPWDQEGAAQYCADWLPSISSLSLPPPSLRMLRCAMHHAKDSATGIDGLPYAAWSADPFGETILRRALGWVGSGQALFDSASITLQAFPSLYQDYVLRVLASLQLPDFFLAFVGFMYAAIEGAASVRGVLVTLFWARSGIIRGDGLSGSLFALGTPSFLYGLAASIELRARGLARACADDTRGALRALSDLCILYRVMMLAEKYANLCLEVAKCKVVPLSARFSDRLVSAVSDKLSVLVPRWAEFEVCDSLLYLGLWLGPGVDSFRSWCDPLAKLRLRAQAIGRGATPTSVSAVLYNTRVVATLSYVAQFCAMPTEVLK